MDCSFVEILRLRLRMTTMINMENLIIIGSGPAGHTAAIYAARARLNPLMFEGMLAAGVAAGGQLTTTTEVENYPGFLQIPGPALMDKMRSQSLRCGARIVTETVDKVDLTQRPFKVWAAGEEYQTKALIVSTGATAKRMHLPGEENLWQKGVSACAVCDGALPFFRDKVLAVIGGGDSAVEEAVYLTKFASKVLMIVRRDVLRAAKVMQDRVQNNPKIEILFNTVPLEVLGEGRVSGLKIKNAISNAEMTLPVGGLFYAIGHLPNTAFLGGQLELDETGYIKTKPGSTKTSAQGVFAAGDVQDKVYRQAVTSAGTGCMAALDAEKFIQGS
jgi:thioredoxin reductase (NADPH)